MNSLDLLLTELVKYWMFDMSVLSNPWMYVAFCIPAVFYLGVFMVKWTVITAPLWLPVALIISAIKGNKK